ncbi:uncharacterized protein LOC118315681 isoform X2 [Scophthalmus maximus]|uniref:uncharacterized protein LOC118315681 isoform X2 n=1 Tax=Scophthalmus maximus TaxID=52904 RepID=UPI001FA8E6F8|nr:uncharacterized protein LOC118315681 isoform X2 [Scophthalmus maximus]
MVDRRIALEALGVLCNANVTSVQQQRSQPGVCILQGRQEQLFIKQLIPSVLDADETCQVSRSSFYRIQAILESSEPADGFPRLAVVAVPKKDHIIDEEEFFAPQFDYDFTKLTDSETYWRGGEKYERPCGWYRFGLKVLDKYCGNTWLGTTYRSTQSCPGEWPVSYHGTSKKGAEGIIGDHYKPGCFKGIWYQRLCHTKGTQKAEQYITTVPVSFSISQNWACICNAELEKRVPGEVWLP